MFEKIKDGIVAFATARKILRILRKNEKDAEKNTVMAIDYKYALPLLVEEFVQTLYKIVGIEKKEFDSIIRNIGKQSYKEELRQKEENQKVTREFNEWVQKTLGPQCVDEDDF